MHCNEPRFLQCTAAHELELLVRFHWYAQVKQFDIDVAYLGRNRMEYVRKFRLQQDAGLRLAELRAAVAGGSMTPETLQVREEHGLKRGEMMLEVLQVRRRSMPEMLQIAGGSMLPKLAS